MAAYRMGKLNSFNIIHFDCCRVKGVVTTKIGKLCFFFFFFKYKTCEYMDVQLYIEKSNILVLVSLT